MIPRLDVRLVPPSELIAGDPLSGHVNTVWTAGHVEIRVDRTAGVDPAVVAPLRRVLSEVLPVGNGAAECPIVRFHLDRAMPDDSLVMAECTPYQTDVYLRAGSMPADVAEEIAGHSTNVARRVRP